MGKEGEGAEERQSVRRREGWTALFSEGLTKVINPGATAVLRGVLHLRKGPVLEVLEELSLVTAASLGSIDC